MTSKTSGRKLADYQQNGKSNTFYIFGGKDESSQDLIQGVTLAGVLFDEVALMPRSFVEQALARCSIEGARSWFNCNPDNPNHWFYREWVLKAPEKHALRLKFLMDDNLSLSDKVKQRYYSLYQGTFYRRFILGEWVIAEGLVYQDYNDHIKDKLWDGNPDELVGRWYISMDYGTINPCSMGLWCVTDNEAIRVDEYYYNSRKEGYQRTDEEHYVELEKLAGDRYIERVIIDPSAASFKATIKRHGKFLLSRQKMMCSTVSEQQVRCLMTVALKSALSVRHHKKSLVCIVGTIKPKKIRSLRKTTTQWTIYAILLIR